MTMFNCTILVGIIAGVSVGRFFGKVNLERATIEQAQQLHAFSTETVQTNVFSLLAGSMASVMVNFVFYNAFFMNNDMNPGAFALAAAVGAIAALLASVFAVAAVIRNPQSVVVGVLEDGAAHE